MSHDLQGVGNAVTQNTGVKEHPDGVPQVLECRRIEEHHENKAPDAAHGKLNAAHPHAVRFRRKVIDHEDVKTEREGTG